MAKVCAWLLVAALPLAACAETSGGDPVSPQVGISEVRPVDPVSAYQFGMLDLDGNGVVTPNEFRADDALVFAILDEDADGLIDEAEFDRARRSGGDEDVGVAMAGEGAPIAILPPEGSGAQPGEPISAFARFDRNADGKLDPSELDDGGDAWFTVLDGDADGRLTPAEMGIGPAPVRR